MEYQVFTVAFDSRYGQSTHIATIDQGKYSAQITKWDSGTVTVELFKKGIFGTEPIMEIDILKQD